MRATCAAASGVFTVMRTSSEPARASASTCRTVASASSVSVLVIDCTTTGAPAPMRTSSTETWREILRFMGSGDGEARDVLLAVRPQVEQAVVVQHLHVAGVADHQVEPAAALHHALATQRVERGQELPPVGVLHLEPCLFFAAQDDAVHAGGRRRHASHSLLHGLFLRHCLFL